MSRRAGTPRTPDEPAFLAAKEAGLRPGSRFIPRPESEQTAPAQEAGVPILLNAKKNPTSPRGRRRGRTLGYLERFPATRRPSASLERLLRAR